MIEDEKRAKRAKRSRWWWRRKHTHRWERDSDEEVGGRVCPPCCINLPGGGCCRRCEGRECQGGRWSAGGRGAAAYAISLQGGGGGENGEVPMLWVDGRTVAVMPCSTQHQIQSTGRRIRHEARQTRLTGGYACHRLPRMPARRSYTIRLLRVAETCGRPLKRRENSGHPLINSVFIARQKLQGR